MTRSEIPGLGIFDRVSLGAAFCFAERSYSVKPKRLDPCKLKT
ncbi:hypothetical protein HMPREF9104_00642 [Lentilactobacillus kisonensis F0435]|uniref:Uncharacterized protein n=1 Tax=Lentilactobacillus kisonensis F0435 TaxID=797516 RepID=H1LDH5_9LACO|nr:hypothetical protein HMPREF9104_00642 [Lentilactobacillus kisonensis F0435]